MKLNADLMELIFEIEYIIGNSCHNPNSYNGYTQEYGCSFRYPIWVDSSKPTDTNENLKKCWSMLSDIPPENIGRIYYKFGTNELSIGSAIRKILGLIESRYSIDFNKLEEKYRQS